MSFNGFSDNTVTSTVKNSAWFPDLDTGVFQNSYRLPAEYQQGMVEEHIRLAMVWVNRQLREWKANHEAAGHNHFNEVPSEDLGDSTEHQVLYQRAVFCHAKGLLLKQFATVNRRDAASNEAKESEETEDKFMEFARDAIADILDIPRIGVEAL
ncbi:head completion/stabilization protein [Endozoicomonas sp. GU-1]|uniref:head completion/stabilization protein n=1 Tax=Endozoicomonas sp. GU-1 TaxID=3009078 RepID=UPI0022B3A27A|nr:head completion/stabilization protein [Endozoicomonas sp. GU-1]WBA86519.1 head completion/stabilization protein [Endozoicomonas sp. GU-1]